MAIATERKNPYSVFNFTVECKDRSFEGGFSEVSGLDTEQGVIEYRTGEEETVMHKLPGLRKHANLVLKRGIVGKLGLMKWREEVSSGEVEKARSDVTVHLCNEKHEKVVTWTIRNAWPVKWVGPSLAASKNETAVETLELAHEGIKMETQGQTG
ncbi:hypothetical protein BE21_04585 [Sorangium cellulosum]|uniref:Phage tail protein n=1 Tax=Sorangium cellulosum TaxID=56 RepID=A0A150TG08_SORCE|nr:hypothetical protein BE21_04585 [Sorangium cellulosum]